MRERKNIEILARFLAYFIVFACLCVYGITHTYALETKTIYPNADFTQNANNYIKLNSNGTAGITNVNLTIQGVAYGFYFSMPEQVSNNKTYTMVINFMDLDLLQSFQSSYVHISSCNSNASCVEASIISVTKSSSTGNSNKLTIKFNAVANGTYFNVGLSSDGPPYQALTGISTFGIKNVQLESSNTSEDIINNQNQNTNNIINNQNSNTQDIIENQNSSASAIMENQNQNTQDLIDSNKVCNYYNYNSLIFQYERLNAWLNSSGNYENDNNTSIKSAITDYIPVSKNSYNIIKTWSTTSRSYCLYDISKVLIECYPMTNNNITFTPNVDGYIRISVVNRDVADANKFTGSYCKNGNEALSDDINDLNDSINDDDIGGATQDGADFILDFDTNTFGLTSIVTAPLNLIQSLTSSNCSELELPLPFLNNKKLKLPCMTTIYQNTFGSLFTMYQTITFGIIAYWVCVRIFNQVKDFKNPEHDEIEVVDL